jgi:hypothetical protein
MKTLLIRFAKLLLKAAMDRALRKALPEIYKRLDGDMPQLLAMAPAPTVVESVVGQAISASTGHRASESQIEAVMGLYDPIAGAIRNLKR